MLVVRFFRNITENQRELRFHVNLRTVGKENNGTVGKREKRTKGQFFT